MMNVAAVLALLRERTGIDPDTLGAGAVQTAVRARLHRLGVRDVAAYARQLQADADEFGRLVEEVVVPETWFFRGGDLFWYLADHIRDAGGAAPVRVLSLPCSTGEEPYSLAIALAERGVPPARWSIEAIDLSPRHIAQARRGVYRDFSFRQLPDDLRDRHFTATADGWEVCAEIRSAVQFRVGNILEPGPTLAVAPFDVIFCRNLFIYLGRDARPQALDTIAGLLRDGGLLCLGHADPLDPADARFVRTGLPGHFLHRRVRMPAPAVPPPVARPVPLLLPAPAPRPAPPRLQPKPAPVAAVAPPDLDQARRLADAGRYDDALAVCRAAQAAAPPSADLFALLGLIHQARGEPADAIAAFHKALYLRPDHREALTHLSLLLQAQGQPQQAAAVLRRLARLPGDR